MDKFDIIVEKFQGLCNLKKEDLYEIKLKKILMSTLLLINHSLYMNKNDVKCWNTLGCRDQYTS